MSATPPLPRWADLILLPSLNLLTAAVVTGLIVLSLGVNPIVALEVMVNGAFFYPNSLGYTLYYTTNFIFTGLAVATAFHALMFNIGGEGQAYIGGLGAVLGGLGAAVLGVGLMTGWPTLIVLPVSIALAVGFGALWALIPGYLQAKRGSHIVITTIMFNFLASSVMVWLLAGPMIQPGQQSPQTSLLPPAASLPSMLDIVGVLGFDIAASPLNGSFFIALIALGVFYVLIWKTRLGFEIRAVGKNQNAAKYAGVNVPRIIIITLAISGGFAGLLATNEVLGVNHRAVLNFTAGYGFTGIAVALMGRNHPIGIFLAALLFGALYQGGSELDFEFSVINREMVVLIQGLIILFSGALALMYKAPLARLLARISPKKEASNG